MDQSKPVALSLLKEIVKQASRLIDDEKPLAESLPKSVGELYDIYILDLFRNITNYELMIEDLRDVSLIAIGLKGLLDESFSTELAIDIKPTWIPKIIYIKFLPQEKIDTFISSGLLNASGELGVTYLKFTHDPLGEYLAGVKILLLYKQGIISDQDLKFIRGSSSSISFLSLLQSSAKRMGIYLP